MYFVGIDIGTSSTKAVVFDSVGTSLGSAACTYEVERSGRGQVEQDPVRWWEATSRTVSQAVSDAGVAASQIVAVGLSGQMHGMVPLGAHGEVIRKAILHSDVRSNAEAAEIERIFGAQFTQITRNQAFPGFQAVSLYWLRTHEPENFARVRKVVCPKDYVRFRLTGILGTEHTDASGTLLYDMEREDWSIEVLTGLGLTPEIVPEHIAQPYEVAGYVTSGAARATGLAAGTPVVYGGADQAMHSVGNGVFAEDAVMATTGSSGQVLIVSSQLPGSGDRSVHTFRHVNSGHVYGLAGVLSAGNALSWYRDQLAVDVSYDVLDEWADKIPAGSDGLVFLPCLAGERTPYMDPDARGVFIGISALHDRRHFARSVMEGVAFAMKTGYDALSEVYGQRDRMVCAGGGSRTAVWSQIQADVFGRDMVMSRVPEQGCLGAAIMAAIGAGVFTDVDSACASMCDQKMRVVHPRKENLTIYRTLYEKVYSKMYANNAQAFSDLAGLNQSVIDTEM